MILTKKEQKQLGIRLPKNVELKYTEEKDRFIFHFEIEKVGKGKRNEN